MASYCIHKTLTLGPLLSKKNSTQTIISNFFKIHFHTILLPIPRSPKLVLTFGTVTKTCTHVISECLLYVSLIWTSLIWFKCEALHTMSWHCERCGPHSLLECGTVCFTVCWYFRGNHCLSNNLCSILSQKIVNVLFYGEGLPVLPPSSGWQHYFWHSTISYSIYLHLYTVSGNHLFHSKPECCTVICSLSRGTARGKKKGGDIYRPTRNVGNECSNCR